MFIIYSGNGSRPSPTAEIKVLREHGMREKALGIIFFLFMVCFLAIIVEETFLGGKRKRRLLREAREKQNSVTKPL